MEQIQMVKVADLNPHPSNPRIDAAQVEDLATSIRVHGIEVPLVATGSTDVDGWVVVAGHRRLAAAIQVGLDEVPAQIRHDLTHDPAAQLAFIATENLHRDQLTSMEESRLVQDMLSLGLSKTEVAKQTALGRARVAERLALAKLREETGEKVHRGQISIDDALVIAEYAGDAEAVKKLEATVGSYQFDYAVSEAARRRADQARATASRKEAKKRGLRVVAGEVVALHELADKGSLTAPGYDDEGLAEEQRDALLEEAHKDCPGHCAIILGGDQTVYDRGRLPSGTLLIGCDQWTLHVPAGATASHPDDDEDEELHDPWDDLATEDFATAKIHRERHLAHALPLLADHPTFDVHTKAKDLAVKKVIRMGWTDYREDADGIDLLQAITGVEGKTKVARALAKWPLSVLIWLDSVSWDIKTTHRHMTTGKHGTSYWGAKSPFRRLLEDTGYDWTPVEQQAILLATGIRHDAPNLDPATPATAGTAAADAADDALAEAGELA
ncbi:ParB/RepB/Spo0J family partition protein [Brachybacterium sp. DNPG3]